MKKDYFYGIYGIEMIWHGEWSDPELIWHGHSFNYYDIETPLWHDYKEACEICGTQPKEDDFAVWVKLNAHSAREYLQNLLENECFYGS